MAVKMAKRQSVSKLSLCVVISIASILVYNSVRSFRSLRYVEELREEFVRATRSGSSGTNANEALLSWSLSPSSSSSYSRTLLTSTTTIDSFLIPSAAERNHTSNANAPAAATILPQRLVPLPSLPPNPKNASSSSSSAFTATTTSSTRTSTSTSGKQEQPLCSRHQIQAGQWVPITLDKPPYVTKTKHLRCYPSSHYKLEQNKQFPSWDWQPTDASCRLAPWNLQDFCQLVQGATVSIIGDSLSWEHYASLLQLAGARVHQNDQHRSKSQKANHVQYACHGNGHDRHDKTTTSTMSTKFVFRNDPRLTQITDSIQHDFPVVLILNRGAHYVNDTVLMQDFFTSIQPAVVQWWRECQQYNVKCHLFWRTTVPGHVGCDQMNNDNDNDNDDINDDSNKNANLTVHNTDQWKFPHPVNDLAVMEARLYNQSLYTDKQWQTFHWQDFPRQNQLVLEELLSPKMSLTLSPHNDSGTRVPLPWTIIDAYQLNMLRPDEHRAHQGDCLHNCYPGKMDVYNQLLLHHLSMQRSVEDVEQLQKLVQRAQSQAQRQRQAAT